MTTRVSTESLKRMTNDNYLDKFGVTTYLKDVITLLLENRPEDPIEFMSNYFGNVIHGSSPLIRSYRYIKLTSRNRESFFDNLVAGYNSLIKNQEEKGVTANELKKLVELVCRDFPEYLLKLMVKTLCERGDPNTVISFHQFASAINSCLLYEEFLKKIEFWFGEMDKKNIGKVRYSKVSKDLVFFTEGFVTTSYFPNKSEITELLVNLKKRGDKDDCVTLRDISLSLFEMTQVDMI